MSCCVLPREYETQPVSRGRAGPSARDEEERRARRPFRGCRSSGTLVIIGAVGSIACSDGWKIVPREPRQPLILGLEAADDEIAEALVVHLDAPQQAGREVPIDANEHVGRSFGTQVQPPGRGQVGEVVGLQQLLVSRALREESRRRRQSCRRVQRNHAFNRGDSEARPFRPL